MGKLEIIHCQDCGSPRMTRYKNTKYCEICRLLRNLKFIGDRKQKCFIDHHTFSPVKRNQPMSLERDPYSTPGGVEGVCGVCREEDKRLYGEHIRVCVKCLDDPSQRNLIVASLIRKQGEIKEGAIHIPTPELPGEAHGQEAGPATGPIL